MKFNRTEELIASMKAGNLVIVLDDEARENEGDLFLAAAAVTPEKINFMITHGRGLLCLPMTSQHAEQLNLPLMPVRGARKFTCNFTWSIEASVGITTGISTFERAHTILTAVKPNAKPQDLVSPGHIFPIIAQDGGVLTRPGHTEASVDLARLAGFFPASVRRDDLFQFATQHQLKIGTIADLIHYRKTHEL